METDRQKDDTQNQQWLEEVGEGMVSWYGEMLLNNVQFKQKYENYTPPSSSTQTAPDRYTES